MTVERLGVSPDTQVSDLRSTRPVSTKSSSRDPPGRPASLAPVAPNKIGTMRWLAFWSVMAPWSSLSLVWWTASGRPGLARTVSVCVSVSSCSTERTR